MNRQPLQTATLKVDAETIRAYAELTDDFNPIHLDPAFAAGTPMGGVIAHGTMSLCLLWQALFRSFGDRAFDGLDLDIRFIKPVRLGETLCAGGTPSTDAGADGCYDVWVRGEDGSDRVVGRLRPAPTC
jgi:3-hydroxybutyryl-CoA dehydratase